MWLCLVGVFIALLDVTSLFILLPAILFISDPSTLNSLSNSTFIDLGLQHNDLIFIVLLSVPFIFAAKNLMAWKYTGAQKKFIFTARADLSTRLFRSYLSGSFNLVRSKPLAEIIRSITGEIGIVINYGLQSLFVFISEGSLLLSLE